MPRDLATVTSGHRWWRAARPGPLDIDRGRRQPPKVIDEHNGIEDLQRFHSRSRRSATHLAASCISGRSAPIIVTWASGRASASGAPPALRGHDSVRGLRRGFPRRPMAPRP